MTDCNQRWEVDACEKPSEICPSSLNAEEVQTSHLGLFSHLEVAWWILHQVVQWVLYPKWIRMKRSCCNLAELELRRNWATWWWRWEACNQIRTHSPSWKSLPQQMRLLPFFAEVGIAVPRNEQNFPKWPFASQFLGVQLELSESSVANVESYRW